MGSEASDEALSLRVEDEVKRLESQHRDLRKQAQALIDERVRLEEELSGLRRRVQRLDEDVRSLRSPPLIIGTIMEVVEGANLAIVRSSNGTVFQVALNQHLDRNALLPGTRVTLNQDSLAVIGILGEAWDPMVTGAEITDRPSVKYDDIGGLDEEITLLREAIELPIERPELFEAVGLVPPKGVLLVGPPGCGKTLMAKAVAAACDATFIRMVGSELAQKYIGEGGRLVRELFALAKDRAPSVIFLDEIDAIGAKRQDGSTSGDREVQRTLMQLLAELDGFDSLEGVSIIAATNRPDILDDALLRPGRFDRMIEIPIPDSDGRRAILDLHLSRMSTSRFDTLSFIEPTHGFSGAELKAVTTEAGMIAIRAERKRITAKDVRLAIERIREKRVGTKGSSPDGLYS